MSTWHAWTCARNLIGVIFLTPNKVSVVVKMFELLISCINCPYFYVWKWWALYHWNLKHQLKTAAWSLAWDEQQRATVDLLTVQVCAMASPNSHGRQCSFRGAVFVVSRAPSWSAFAQAVFSRMWFSVLSFVPQTPAEVSHPGLSSEGAFYGQFCLTPIKFLCPIFPGKCVRITLFRTHRSNVWGD